MNNDDLKLSEQINLTSHKSQNQSKRTIQMEDLDNRRHFYFYAKYHYGKNDMIKDLSFIYNNVYGFDIDDDVPIIYLLEILSSLAKIHIFKYDYIYSEFINDILPENTWAHGYITNKTSILYEKNNEEYDVKKAMISKFLSILRLSKVIDIPFELGKPDKKTFDFSQIKKHSIFQ